MIRTISRWKVSLVAGLLLTVSVGILSAASPLRPRGRAPEPRFNRLYDYEEMAELLQGYADAYPRFVKLSSIGRSREDRELWMLTINNPDTGPAASKPAVYIDGNIHANEVQGAETALYTVEYLLRNYGRLDRVSEILDRSAFFILPMVNPDGRSRWFKDPSTPHFPRTVAVPRDDDRDGVADEDPYDDIDGNGIITQMRKKVPLGQGTHRIHPKDPRLLVRVEADELGDYIQLGTEGFDNDGDGRVNEDVLGYIDPNRTFGYNWQPPYIQRGAGDYPLQIPETRAIALWLLEHTNIAAMQSYHNSGQMILRPPGAKGEPPLPRSDVSLYDFFGAKGEEVIPGYDYMIIWKDLYTVYGGTVNHFFGIHGIVSFTNELYGAPRDMNSDGTTTQEERLEFSDLLTLGRQFVEWTTFDHPQYGEIEVGGYRHDVGRVPEGWQLEEECHRNNAFMLFQAWHLPRLTVGEPVVKKLGGRLWRLEVPVTNDRAIPTMTGWARSRKLHRPDIATIDGGRVVSSGIIENQYLDSIRLQDHRPEKLMVSGVDGMSTRLLFFLVEGDGPVTFRYDSLKAAEVTRRIELR